CWPGPSGSYGDSSPRLSCYRTSRKMQPELDRGYLQRVRVAQVSGEGGRKVALFEVRMPGETVHLVCAAGLGVGVLDAARRARVRDARRPPPAPGAPRGEPPPPPPAAGGGEPMNALWRARLEGASVVRVGLQAIELAREGRSVVAGSIGAGKG